jgi:uncharacterized protein
MHSWIYTIVKSPVIIYFALTIIISWGAVLFAAGPGGIPPANIDESISLGVVLLLGPSVASLLMISWTHGSTGLRDLGHRLVKWRVSVYWYLIALLIAPLLSLTTLLLLSIFSTNFIPRIFISDNKTSILQEGIIGGIVVAFFEELGWTGFAIPKIKQKYGVFETGLLLGLVWGVWHFILFWESDTFSGALFPFLLLAVRLFSWLPPYRILMVWVYSRTESLFVAILMHMSLVVTLTVIDPELSGWNLLAFILACAVMIWIVAVAVVSALR